MYLLLPLIALVANLGLALFAWRGQWQAKGGRPFALFLLSMAMWGGLLYMMRSSATLEDAYLWEKLVIVDLALITVLFLHFTYSFARLSPFKLVMPLAYSAVAVIGVATFLGVIVTGMQLKDYGYAFIMGPGFVPFLVVTYTATAIGLGNIGHAIRHGESPAIRNRASYVMAGIIASLIGATTDVLPVLGVPIFPAGIVGNVLFAVLVTFAMLKGRLIDIKLVGRKSISSALLVGFVLATYALVHAVIGRLSGTALAPPAMTFTLTFAVVVVATVPRFNERVQRWVDQGFFRGRYSSLRALERFSQGIRDITDADTFASTLVELVRRSVDAQFVGLLQPDGRGGGFRLTAASGIDLSLSVPFAAGSAAFARLARLERVMFAEELSLLPEWQALSKATRDALEKANFRLYVPVISRGELAGVLLLGQRERGGRYSQEDVDLLQAVANQAATGMENARLYQEVHAQLATGRKRTEAFQAAASRLALEENADQTLEQLVEAARDLVGARHGAVVVWNAQGEAVKVIGEYLPTLAAAGLGGPPSISRSPSDADTPSSLASSFRSRDLGRGVFYLEGKSDDTAFNDDDQRLLDLFAMLASVLIDNLRLYAAQTRERSTLTAIQASITEGLVVLDADGRVVYFNGAAETLLAVAASAAKGRLFSELVDARAPDFEDPSAAATALMSLVDGSAKDARVDLVMVRPQRLDLSLSSFPIALSPDEGMVGILIRDVTQDRDLDRRRDTFVSVASHELRTPMTTIIGFTDLLLDEVGNDSRQQRWLKYISEETQRLTGILDDMLDVSRIQSGKVGLTVERIAMHESIADVVAVLAPTTEMHDFIVDCGPFLPKVLADRNKLSQVLMNLLTNAMKYSPKGGRIVVSGRHEPRDERVVISISDEGIGIHPKDAEAVFETFHRVRNAETDHIRGSGLGLYIVRQLVGLMGGEVWLESEPGRGSTFFFTVPIARLGSRVEESAWTP